MLDIVETLKRAAAAIPGEKALVMSFHFYFSLSTRVFPIAQAADKFLTETFDYIAIVPALAPGVFCVITKDVYDSILKKYPLQLKRSVKSGFPPCTSEQALVILGAMRKFLKAENKHPEMVSALDVAIFALAKQIQEEKDSK